MADRMAAHITFPEWALENSDIREEVENYFGIEDEWESNVYYSRENGLLTLGDYEVSWGEFEDLEDALKENKVAYDRWTDAKYDFRGETVFYRPGSKPDTFNYDIDGEYKINAEDIRRLLGKPHLEEKIRKLLPKVVPCDLGEWCGKRPARRKEL